MAQTMSPQLHQYFEDIITNSRFNYLQGRKREQKIEELHGELLDTLNAAYLNVLSPVELTAFNHMRVKHADAATLGDFLQTHIKNKSEITHQVFTDFPKRYAQ